jgi:predicted DNA-binding transcriptional regulator AlpA
MSNLIKIKNKDRFMIKTSELKKILSIKSFNTLKKAYTEGDLPHPIRLSTHSIAWDSKDIRIWMLNRVKVRSYPKLTFDIPEIDEATHLEFLSLKDVLKISTKNSSTTIYTWMKKGEFPVPVQILNRKVGWFLHEIEAWIAWRKKHR